MNDAKQRPRLAVISPFLDKRHGSERVIVEWLSHLPDEFEIHVYAQDIEDLDRSKIVWHRISKLRGPHLLNFLWWLAAVRFGIARDRRLGGLRHDLVFSSGANYSGADVICVHIVFARYVLQVGPEMRFSRTPVWHWPRLIHRRLYYHVVTWVERRCYMNPATTLVVHSEKTLGELRQCFERRDRIPVVYLGVDHSVFNVARRAALRRDARRLLELADDQFALILVGNDWRNKGVPVLLEALEQLRELPIQLLVVSREDSSACRALVKEKHLENRVCFLPPRKDIEFYYAAADAYAGPSLQDSYAMPPAEAMACGLPVIVSATAGVSEIISNGIDGLILNDPRDSVGLAALISRLYEDARFRDRLGEKASETTRQHTWEGNGRELAAIFDEALRRNLELARHPLGDTRGSATR